VSGEQPVQLGGTGHLPAAGIGGIAGDFDEELLPHREEQPLDLPASLRLTGQFRLSCG
jgi:hypothetical protein